MIAEAPMQDGDAAQLAQQAQKQAVDHGAKITPTRQTGPVEFLCYHRDRPGSLARLGMLW